MVDRILIACRGVVATRAIVACRRRGLSPIAVAARADPNVQHAAFADMCVPLPGRTPADSYENACAIASAARRCAADFVYPGCGALAEDPGLVENLDLERIRTVGPSCAALKTLRDKSTTANLASLLGVPTLAHATTTEQIDSLVAEIGFPIVIKPRSGCLGDGQHVVRRRSQLSAAIDERAAHPAWYAEQYLDDATVVGVTICIDAVGAVVHLGERETLLTREGRKLLDASPPLTISGDLLSRMRADTRALARHVEVDGVVTCEFIVAPGVPGYFFLEMNPRLSGGFRMCEAQSGLDLIELQLAIAQGEQVPAARMCIDTTVHCLESRWYRQPGQSQDLPFLSWSLPTIRSGTVDSAVRERCSLAFDTLFAQLFTFGPSREIAAARLIEATDASVFVGGPRHYGRDIANWLAVAQNNCLTNRALR